MTSPRLTKTPKQIKPVFLNTVYFLIPCNSSFWIQIKNISLFCLFIVLITMSSPKTRKIKSSPLEDSFTQRKYSAPSSTKNCFLAENGTKNMTNAHLNSTTRSMNRKTPNMSKKARQASLMDHNTLLQLYLMYHCLQIRQIVGYNLQFVSFASTVCFCFLFIDMSKLTRCYNHIVYILLVVTAIKFHC